MRSRTIHAWTALDEKRAGEWRLVSVTPTECTGRPDEIASA
jgi:hypothetical protein